MNAFYSFPIFSEVPELPKENLSATKNEYLSVPHRPPQFNTLVPLKDHTQNPQFNTPLSYFCLRDMLN